MTFGEFVDKYTGKGIDYDGKYGNQCMDLYRQYVKEVLNFPQSPPVTGAKDVWDTYLKDKYDRIDNTPTGVPQKGDVIVWGTVMGEYGHIAIFDNGNTSTFTSFDQNFPIGSLCHLQKHDYKGVLGWLRPKLIVEDNMTEQEKLMLDFIRVNQITEGQLREGYGYVKDGTVEKLNKEIEALKVSQKDMEERISQLEAENKANNDLILDWQSKVTSANKALDNANKSNIELVAEKNKYKGWYETALKKTIDKYTAWQLIRMGINKLIVQSKK